MRNPQKIPKTILQEKNSENYKDIKYQLHEAPYHFSSSLERMLWVYYGQAFFPKELEDLYKIYKKPLFKGENPNLPIEEEYNERKRYIKHPILTANLQEKPERVIGGIWIDNSVEDTATIHIVADQNEKEKYKGFTHEMMNSFKEMFKQDYNTIKTCWGRRTKDTDPTKFLQEQGFYIEPKISYNVAILHL